MWKTNICDEWLGGIEPAMGQENGMSDLLMFFPAWFPMHRFADGKNESNPACMYKGIEQSG